MEFAAPVAVMAGEEQLGDLKLTACRCRWM